MYLSMTALPAKPCAEEFRAPSPLKIPIAFTPESAGGIMLGKG